MAKGRKPNTALNFLQQIDPLGGCESCWPWLGFKNPKGYGQFSLKDKTILAHRWSYQHHYGISIPQNMHVCHSCDNPACCNPLHLSLGTNQDNVNDKMKRGRFRPKQTKFTQEELNTMKHLREAGMSRDKLGKLFGCHKATIAHHERLGFLKSNQKTS
jgi:hypothetical protein